MSFITLSGSLLVHFIVVIVTIFYSVRAYRFERNYGWIMLIAWGVITILAIPISIIADDAATFMPGAPRFISETVHVVDQILFLAAVIFIARSRISGCHNEKDM
jgi:purine-cytosine permease-like protein